MTVHEIRCSGAWDVRQPGAHSTGFGDTEGVCNGFSKYYLCGHRKLLSYDRIILPFYNLQGNNGSRQWSSMAVNIIQKATTKYNFLMEVQQVLK